MCAEALVHSLNRSEASGKFNGIRLSTNRPSVYHLLFADDCLLLCKASAEESIEIKRILSMYEEASGQTINLAKSPITFGSKIEEPQKQNIKDVL